MNTKILTFALAALALTLVTGAPAQDFNRAFIGAAEKAKQSVVNIIIYKSSEREGGKHFVKTGYGSGTIITHGGHIVTNYHVVRKGNFYQVIHHNGRESEVKRFDGGAFYLADEKTDLAVLKIDPEAVTVEPVAFDDSDNLAEGEWVIAIGNPYGLRQSITAGIVSSIGRSDVGFADIEDFIQTDVPINPGNSGGPLINLRGKLVGINTAIRTVSGGYQGISFAIPSNIVKNVCAELLRHGRVKRGWLGFLARERQFQKNGERKIVEIISVIKDSPAQAAGFARGDLIKEIDGKEISSMGSLVKIVGGSPVGATLKITVAREGHLHDFALRLREKTIYRNIRRQRDDLYRRYGIELDENARTGETIISYLSPLKEGYQNGLKKGDTVLSLNGREVASMEKFLGIYSKSRNRILKIDLLRGDNRFSVEFIHDLEQD
jgi:serine protease Do